MDFDRAYAVENCIIYDAKIDKFGNPFAVGACLSKFSVAKPFWTSRNDSLSTSDDYGFRTLAWTFIADAKRVEAVSKLPQRDQ
jgi:hypothetical protein